MLKDKTLKLDCHCGGYHFIEFGSWDLGEKEIPETWQCMVNADNTAPWYFRIKEAIKYIFGKNLNLHDVCLEKKDLLKLKKFLEETLR